MTPAAGPFNVSEYLLDRHVRAGRGGRIALTTATGQLSYAELTDRVRQAAAGLRALGLQPEQRLVMVMADSPEFVIIYLAAMRIGAVPVPISTMLRPDGIAEILIDSRARVVAMSSGYRDTVAGALSFPGVTEVMAVVSDDVTQTGPLAGLPDEIYPTTADSPAFWLYTSGTTGTPKGAMHRHGSVQVVCETYGTQVLGITPEDRCLSAAKAFFAYGLGNSVLFPLSVGATAILEAAPSRPDVIAERARAFGATLFFAGPTFFSNMLRAGLPPDALAGIRLAASAGETLPAALYQRWTSHFGIDILDGIGMTEMLHIFLSNRPGRVRAGTTGVPVPGYELRVLGEDGQEVPLGTPGTLFVRGASAATGYWSRYDASRQVFQGEWLRTGDTYVIDADGYYTCLGRTGDMLKASGIWVSPAEVESRLLAHADVAQAVVVAANDTDGLEKPVAFVQLHPGRPADEQELINFCKLGLPSFKRPRRIMFVAAYPTTATGKIRRVELRAQAEAILQAMTLTWTKENSPRWDAGKQQIFGPAELAAAGLAAPTPGAPVANEWWRVTNGDELAGYGWLDSEWGDARITFVVAPGQRGRGVGDFILEHLEDEAAARGLNYIYNVVPDTHPDGAWIRNWLSTHGFHEAFRGQLRRQVSAARPADRKS